MSNYFEIFDLSPKLDLDLNSLEEQYLQLQLQFHPDLLIHKTQKEQELAKIKISQINNAYEILKDPLKRAIYFLEINNIFIDSIKPDNMLLVDIMEIKEELEEGNEEKVNLIKADLKKRKEDLYQEIINLSNKNLISDISQKVVILKYLSSI